MTYLFILSLYLVMSFAKQLIMSSVTSNIGKLWYKWRRDLKNIYRGRAKLRVGKKCTVERDHNDSEISVPTFIYVVSCVTYITDDSIRCRPESLKRYMSICVKWLINGKQRACYTFAPLNGRFIDRRSLRALNSQGAFTNHSANLQLFNRMTFWLGENWFNIRWNSTGLSIRLFHFEKGTN